MTAAAHIWRRMRRRFLLACWRARLRQIEPLIQQLDRQIAADHAARAKLQVERRVLRNRIADATRPPVRSAQPLTWGL